MSEKKWFAIPRGVGIDPWDIEGDVAVDEGAIYFKDADFARACVKEGRCPVTIEQVVPGDGSYGDPVPVDVVDGVLVVRVSRDEVATVVAPLKSWVPITW